MSSISLNESNPTFGSQVTFTTDGIPKNVKNPRIEVLAYDTTTGELLYGEAGAITDFFTLGGGSSKWVDRGGGPAHCVANLFYFDNHGPTQNYVQLATTSFDAAG